MVSPGPTSTGSATRPSPLSKRARRVASPEYGSMSTGAPLVAKIALPVARLAELL